MLTYVSRVRTIVCGVVLAACAARASAAPPTSRAEGEGALIAIPLAHSPDTSRSLLPEPPLDGAAGDAAISGIANVRAAVPLSMSSLAAKLDEFMRTHFRLSGTVPREGRVTLRFRFDASGSVESGEVVELDCDPALQASIVAQFRALVDGHARVDTLTPDEAATLAGHYLNLRIPLGPRVPR